MLIVCALAATGVNWIQDDRIADLKRQITQQQQQLDRQRDQITQLNREVFKLPTIKCTNCVERTT